MAGRLIYVTYADGRFVGNFRSNAWAARVLGGAARTILFTRDDLEASPVYAPHRDVFDAPRGAGYWAWKPWAILRALDESQPGDVLLYQDCGFGLRYKLFLAPRELMALATARGFLAGVCCPQFGPNRRWNRKACLALMGCEGARFTEALVVQATLSLWTNIPQARAFLQEWLRWCLTHDAVRDAQPEEYAGESADFVTHRHDQAILTNLAVLRDAPVIDPLPATLDFEKSAAMLELDLRARKGGGAAVLLRLISGAARWRRGGTGV